MKDDEYKRLMKNSSFDEVKTIHMFQATTKKIKPIKILLDNDSEVRATNFHGTTKNGRNYISPQVVFMRATGKDKSMDISFPFDHLQTIIDALTTIKNENENDELLSKM